MEALQIYNGCDPEDGDNIDNIIQKLDIYILGDVSETMERYKFNTRKQKSDESIDCYVATLKTCAKTSNFCKCVKLKDSLIRDRLVLGANNPAIKARLLQERSLTLHNCIDICRSYENASSELKMLTRGENNSAEVHKINKFSTKANGRTKNDKKMCKFCGFEHIMKNKEMCPAWGKSCDNCKKMNHFAKCCKTKPKKKHLHVVRNDSDSSDTETVSIVKNNSGGIYAKAED